MSIPPLLSGLRGWQKDAYHEYFRLPRRDFLLVATPGAGKTRYALTVAAELLARREVATLTIVTPTEHLKHQWAQAASGFGIAIDSAYSNAQGRAGADFAGVAVTYAQVAAHPALHRQRTENRRTLVIFDEIHHAGDALSWGDAVKEAFDGARRRIALTGTPFRSDANPIPFVSYVDEPGGGKRSASDYVYGYGPALEDGVVRPVIFLAYSGEMRWRTRAGDEITATLGTPMTKDQIAQAWRTALDPAGEWVGRVLEAADKRLTEVRRDMPAAAGLVIAGDHADARAYAALLRGLTGKRPAVVLSTIPRPPRRSPRSLTPATAGWLPCEWSPRAWISPAWPSACTPPACPPPCISPRPWAASSGRAGGARRPRCSCPRYRSCSGSPPSWRPNGTTCFEPSQVTRPRRTN